MIISHAEPLFCWRMIPWFMTQTNADKNGDGHAGDPSVLAREWF